MKKKLAAAALTAALAVSGTALFTGTAQAIPAGCKIEVTRDSHSWDSTCYRNRHYSDARFYFDSGYSDVKRTDEVAPGVKAKGPRYPTGKIMDGPWIHLK